MCGGIGEFVCVDVYLVIDFVESGVSFGIV